MRVWSNESVVDHPWERVTAAAWRKYPNTSSPHVASVDVVNRSIKNGVLHSTRLFQCIGILPAWTHRFLGIGVFAAAKPQDLSSASKPIAGPLQAGSAAVMPAAAPKAVAELNFVEVSSVDPKRRFFQMVSRNVSIRKYVSVTERCTYTAHPTDPNK
jgi:hypothetical protein